jgi:hypothetical protein
MKLHVSLFVSLLAVAFAASAVSDAYAGRGRTHNPNMVTVHKPKQGEKRCEINGTGQKVCRTQRN